jgi:hypothetical protein
MDIKTSIKYKTMEYKKLNDSILKEGFNTDIRELLQDHLKRSVKGTNLTDQKEYEEVKKMLVEMIEFFKN